MKLQAKILAILLLVVSVSAMAATEPSKTEAVAKILPSGNRDLLKLLYFNPGEKQVKIKFYGTKGTIYKEKISDSQFKDGFIKFYDVSTLEPGNYWVEIADSERKVTYNVTFTKETMWVTYWNNYLPRNQAIALKD